MRPAPDFADAQSRLRLLHGKIAKKGIFRGAIEIYRLTIDGKKWVPSIEEGCFVLGDPKHGRRKHKSENAVRVRAEQEAIDLLHKGFSIRIQTQTRASLVRKNLYVDGKLLT